MKVTKFYFYNILIGSCIFTSCATEKKLQEDILQTKDIARIEQFLKTAHPEDPRRIVLKPKLANLKNEAWTKGKDSHKPMAARIVYKEENTEKDSDKETTEEESFTRLMNENDKDKTIRVLNQIFDNDISNKEMVLMVKNYSKCNMILHIKGGQNYQLPIPAQGENSIIVTKGSYTLSGSICGAQYSSVKELNKSYVLALNAVQPSDNPTEIQNPPIKKTSIPKKTTSKKSNKKKK